MTTGTSPTMSTPTTSSRRRVDRTWTRATAVGGLVFFLLVIGWFGSLTSGSPAATDSRLEVWNYVVDHHDRLQLAAALYSLAMAAALLWLSGLYGVLRSAEDGRPRLATAALAGGVLAAAGTLTGALVLGVTATRFADLGPAGVRVFWTMFLLSIGGTLAGQAVVLGSTAAVSLRTRLFSAWFRVATVVLALVSVAGVFAMATPPRASRSSPASRCCSTAPGSCW